MRILQPDDKREGHASNAPIPRALQESGAGKPEGGQQTSVSRVLKVIHEKQRREVSHISSPCRRQEIPLQHLWEKIQGEHTSHSPHEKSYR